MSLLQRVKVPTVNLRGVVMKRSGYLPDSRRMNSSNGQFARSSNETGIGKIITEKPYRVPTVNLRGVVMKRVTDIAVPYYLNSSNGQFARSSNGTEPQEYNPEPDISSNGQFTRSSNETIRKFRERKNSH